MPFMYKCIFIYAIVYIHLLRLLWHKATGIGCLVRFERCYASLLIITLWLGIYFLFRLRFNKTQGIKLQMLIKFTKVL